MNKNRNLKKGSLSSSERRTRFLAWEWFLKKFGQTQRLKTGKCGNEVKTPVQPLGI